MAAGPGSPPRDGRAELERQLSADLRLINAESDRISRMFASLHHIGNNDFEALQHIIVAEQTDTPLTLRDLRDRLGMTGAAVTYLVDRMVEAGHIRRVPHHADRRKTTLRYSDHGMAVAREFFAPLGARTRQALGQYPDADLATAHRVFGALAEAMQSHAGVLSNEPDDPPIA